MLVAIALVVRLGGRIYAGALLRTGGKTKLREALRAERLLTRFAGTRPRVAGPHGMQLGYTMMTEQAGPKDLVGHV